MKRLVLGILAHVDSGKTTLSEALLYNSGAIRTQGRVDHKNAYLDTNEIEKDRGITIFSKQAIIKNETAEITLLDTPGHVDFSAEAERVLSVLDYAVLLISAPSGVQSHTLTLWNLLSHYKIPTFLFINKTDLFNEGKDSLLTEIKSKLSPLCQDFSCIDDAFFENAATNSEELLDEYLRSGEIKTNSLKDAIKGRKIFPCFFGSALKGDGVNEFLTSLFTLTKETLYPKDLGGKVFKISEDDKGQRLTHVKITGGSLQVKNTLPGKDGEEKINEIRLYHGKSYTSLNEALPGQVVALTGLSSVDAGTGIGFEKNPPSLLTESVFTYTVALKEGTDLSYALSAFRKVEAEETKLSVSFSEDTGKIDVSVMGKIQLEVLKRILSERFSLDVDFESRKILYKETIKGKSYGFGHFEPLRHYAEVHLLLEEAPRGSGLLFATDISEDLLSKNWQRLILTHLSEKTHRGVLTGAPLTDVKITLINGKAHLKHTEGGDFRQATYRAVRQGLMQGESQLLEPYYDFSLRLPTKNLGRALSDLDRMGASFSSPVTDAEISIVKGRAPVSLISEYPDEINSYTHGEGNISFSFSGYDKCVNSEEVIEKSGYDPEGDLRNSPDSVFCAGGSGFLVKWNEVTNYMHLPMPESQEKEIPLLTEPPKKKNYSEDELMEIFERTYGKIKERKPDDRRDTSTNFSKKEKPAKPYKMLPIYLLIDGYNIIFSWPETKSLAEKNIDAARDLLIDKVCSYNALKDYNIILVFDAYKVRRPNRDIEDVNGIKVVYTKTAETADSYIEKTSKELIKNYRVVVATGDFLEQVIIFGHGASRISATEFFDEVQSSLSAMREIIKEKSEANAFNRINIDI